MTSFIEFPLSTPWNRGPIGKLRLPASPFSGTPRVTGPLFAIPSALISMSAEIRLQPLTEHGRELLDELERSTREFPVKIEDLGARTYYLSSSEGGAPLLQL
jgi:hypothetical protein